MSLRLSTRRTWPRDYCYQRVPRTTQRSPCYLNSSKVRHLHEAAILILWLHFSALECGPNFTSKLEGMFKDMELSREMLNSFKEVCAVHSNL